MSCIPLKRCSHLQIALFLLLALVVNDAFAANDVAGTLLAFNQNGG
jgi:hypothetical protein